MLALMTLVLNMFVSVQKDAEIALDVARQHGQELLEVRASITQIREELSRKTVDRYYRQEAEREHARLEKEIKELEEIVRDR
ncbi:MAG: hypothetical protein JSW00_08965 [Thermoplasmata archaeon]|nr:MAG: hypothetical protein JSW00_08965 [Thermoplasmata archaeon]